MRVQSAAERAAAVQALPVTKIEVFVDPEGKHHRILINGVQTSMSVSARNSMEGRYLTSTQWDSFERPAILINGAEALFPTELWVNGTLRFRDSGLLDLYGPGMEQVR